LKTRLFAISILLAFITFKASATASITTTGSGFSVPATTYGTTGAATSSTTFTVAGSGLSTGITVTPASTSIQVSLSPGSGFGTSVYVAAASGSVASTPIYVRITSTAPYTSYTSTTISCVSGSASKNVNCNFVVNKASLSITANVPARYYGTAISGASGSASTYFTATGLQNGETIGTVVIYYYNGGNTATSAAGTYTASIGSGSASGGTFTASNYSISYNNGNMIVSPAPLTVTVNDVSKTYGATLTGASGSTAFTSSGLQNGETIGSVTIAYGTGSAASAATGTYTSSVTASAATGGTFSANNYTISYVQGNITVTGATLTITGSASKTYGTAITGGSGSTAFIATGLQNGETVGTVTVAYGTGASATSAAGIYTSAVTPGAATGGTFNAANYTIVYVAGSLVVNARALTLTSAAAGNKVYDGTTAATITSTLSGIVNSDVVTLNGTGTFASANVGTGIAVTSACTLSGSGAGNYTLTQPTGLTANITKAPLTITATGPQYDATSSMATVNSSTTNFTYTGTVNGETITSVTLTPNKSGTNPAGTAYTVTPSSAAGSGSFSTGNYTITYVSFSGVVGNYYTWTGNTNSKWSVSTNWTNGATNGVPGTNDNVYIPATTNMPTVDVASSCGSVYIAGTTTLTLSAVLTASGSLTVGGNGYTFAIAGSSSASFGGLTDMGYQSSFTIGSGATVTFNSNSTINNNSSQRPITNNGTLNFLANCTLNAGYGTSLVNNGTISAASTTFNFANTGIYITNNKTFKATSCAFNMTGSQAYFLNTGASASFTTNACTFTTTGSQAGYFSNAGSATYVDHGSAFTMTGSLNYISNAGTMTLHGTTINFSTGGSNAQYITNSSVLTIDSGATVNLSTYKSNIVNTGTFYAGTSNSACRIYLNGQSSNVSNNGGTFNLASTSVIYPSAAQCYINNNSGTFTLMSDKYGTASIMSFYTTGGNLATSSGNFNVQRYITGGSGYRGYRFLSSPVNYSFSYSSSPNIYAGNFSLKYVNTDVGTAYAAVTGGPSGGGFTVNNANPTMYLYNESIASNNTTFTGGKDVGITGVTSTTVTTLSAGTTASGVSLPVGNGYMLYFIGSDASGYTTSSQSPSSATLTATGPLNLQSIPVVLWWSGSKSLSYTSAYGTNAGYNLVGNPYPCAIDLYQVYTDNGSVYGNFAELNDYGQTFVYYNASTGGTSTPATYRYVASGQAFLVQATATGQTLTFNEDQKYYDPAKPNNNGSNPPVLLNSALAKMAPAHSSHGAAVASANVLSGLHLMLKKDSINYTYCGMYFDKNWSDAYNNKTDAFDLGGMGAKVFLSSLTSDNVRTTINSLSDYSRGKKVKLYVRGTTDGIYQLNMADIANIDTTNYTVYLVDTKLNDSLDMVHYKTYNFNLYIADTASFANRFVLSLQPKPAAPYDLITFSGKKGSSNAIQLSWKTANEGNFTTFGLEKLGSSGRYTLIDSVQSNGSGLYSFNDPSPAMGNNIYRLAQNDIHGHVTFAGPININYNTIAVSGMFTIYPNPSKDLINIAVNSGVTGSQPTPLYLASIYSISGTTMMDNRQINTNNWTQDITGYKAGVYILELKTIEGDIVGKAKFLKTN